MQPHSELIRLIALLRDDETRRTVRSELGAYTPLRIYTETSELLAAARQFSPPCALVEIDGSVIDGTVATVRSLVACSPNSFVIGLCEMTSLTAQRIVAAAAVGLRRVVIRGVHDLATEVAHCFQVMDGDRVRQQVLRIMSDRLTPFASVVLHRALTDLRHAPTVGQLALALAVPRRTLIRRFELGRLPTPHDMLGWARVIAAAVLLEGSERSIELVAHEVGCPSSVGLRRLTFRYAGVRPSDLRKPGSVQRLRLAYERFLEGTVRHHQGCTREAPRGVASAPVVAAS